MIFSYEWGRNRVTIGIHSSILQENASPGLHHWTRSARAAQLQIRARRQAGCPCEGPKVSLWGLVLKVGCGVECPSGQGRCRCSAIWIVMFSWGQ